MVNYEKNLGSCGVLTTPEVEELIIYGWALVYYFRECPHCDDTVQDVWSSAGDPYLGRVQRDRAEGRLDPRLRPPGSMTKPARR
jgi:hypothetical protein